jgi:predicted DNA-binding transcriptional regulator YafY
MPIIKAALARIRIIDEAIRNTGRRYPNLEELVEIVSRKLDRSISRSTIEKDIQYMKSQDAPLRFNTSRGGFEYTEIGYSFFQLPVSEEDMDAIRIAAETLRQYNNIPVFKQFQHAIIKMNEKLKLSESFGEEIIDRTIMFESAPIPTGVEYLSDLVSAARNLQIIRFEYENIYKGKTASYELHPYLIKEYRNKWYLIGWSEDRKDYLTFGLDRILTLDLQRQTYSRRKDFNPDIFFKYSIGITEFDHKPQDIVLSFDPIIGKLIKAQALHHTQSIVSDTPKALKISLRLLVTEELIQTLLAFGNKVTVQKPASLKSEVKDRLKKALENY